MRTLLILIFSLPLLALSQKKKPLTHSVYDGWESATEKKISDNGHFVAYTINPQEGDGNLYVQSLSPLRKVYHPCYGNPTIITDRHR